jgi:hypothetical protein
MKLGKYATNEEVSNEAIEVSNKVQKLSNQFKVVSIETWKVCNKRGSHQRNYRLVW